MDDKHLIAIDAVKEWEQNPRNIKKDDLERLKSQLELLGQHSPLLVTSDGTVLGGNMRLKALRELGVKRVWVTLIEFKQDEQGLWFAQINGVPSPKKFQTKEDGMMEFSLSHNDRAGFYDEDLLANIEGNYNIDWDQYSVDLSEPITLADLFIDDFQAKEDEPPEVDDLNPPKSEPGTVYQLGRHKLMCGDSTKIEDVEKLTDGQKADMVFTDPPYGVDYEGKTAEKLKIQGDTNSKVWEETIPNFLAAVKEGGSFYVCCPPGNKLKEFVLPFETICYLASNIIWVKNTLIMGHSDYQYKHEPILYGWLSNGTHKFYGDRTQTTVWEVDKPNQSLDDPTTKPIALITKALSNSSQKDEIVLDLFGGSGSTLIACEQLNRTCYMMELDPKYCDVIRKRYAQLIGDSDNWEVITPALLTP